VVNHYYFNKNKKKIKSKQKYTSKNHFNYNSLSRNNINILNYPLIESLYKIMDFLDTGITCY